MGKGKIILRLGYVGVGVTAVNIGWELAEGYTPGTLSIIVLILSTVLVIVGTIIKKREI